MKKIILAIDGMTCSACSNGLEKYLNKQKGISSASVNLVMSNALIEYDEKLLNQEKIEEFVKQAGFKSLGLYKDIEQKDNRKKEKIKFIIFTILAIILMYISMGHMIGLPSLEILDMHKNPLIYTSVLLVLTIAFIVYGFDIIKNGYKNLIHKSPNMDTLVSIGILSSILYSLFSMFMIIRGHHEYVESLYFESAAIIIYFVKLGRYIDGISKDKTKDAIQKLVQITPKDAVIKVDGKEKRVTIDEIRQGDIVVSKPGEKIAVDGEIINGKTHLDESFITGESKPSLKEVGSKVIAGSINYDGYIEYKAEKIGKDSTISEIVRLVVEATNTKAPIAKLADKASSYFVPAVMLIAVITFIVYLIFGFEFGSAINAFISVLVVACPCSLGLATPLAIVVSEGKCATNGILVKKSETLENAGKTNVIIFDKTGTLTYGALRIADVINYTDREEKEIIKLAASLEQKSTHPIEKAFTQYLTDNKQDPLEVKDFNNVSGYGLTGTVDGKRIVLGNSKILEKENIKLTKEDAKKYKEDEEKLASKGNSIVYLVVDNKVLAIIGVNDVIRENTKEVISKLNDRGIKTIMLTGDNKQTAEKIAKEIGITEVIADVTPHQKAETVKKLKAENKHVMMCGDGINDSPALANSDIGVSVNSGTDIAIDSSDVILTRNDLNSIVELLDISKKTVRNIKQNLFWAFFYNALMIPIAIGLLRPLGIEINPMIASLAMVFSSLTVILNALRLR